MHAAQPHPIEAVRGRDEKERPVGEARRPCQGSAPGGESGAIPMAMVSSSGDVAIRQEYIWGACLDERCAKLPQEVDNSVRSWEGSGRAPSRPARGVIPEPLATLLGPPSRSLKLVANPCVW